jgi:hypothetical protein
MGDIPKQPPPAIDATARSARQPSQPSLPGQTVHPSINGFIVLDDVAGDGKISVIGRDSGRPRSRRFVVSPSRRAAAWGAKSLRF